MYRATMITTQCAWCGQVKVGGRYARLGQATLVHEIDLPSKSGKSVHSGKSVYYEVSHGICEPCKGRLLGHSLAA